MPNFLIPRSIIYSFLCSLLSISAVGYLHLPGIPTQMPVGLMPVEGAIVSEPEH